MSPGTPYSLHSKLPYLHSCRNSRWCRSSARGAAPSHIWKEHCRVGYSRPPSVVPFPPPYSVALALLRPSALLVAVEMLKEDPVDTLSKFSPAGLPPARPHCYRSVDGPGSQGEYSSIRVLHDPPFFITRLCFILAAHVLTSGDVSKEGRSDMKGHESNPRQ
jgi:hypothetical protein